MVRTMMSALLAATALGTPAMAKDYFLASGRWDNVVLVIDLERAMDPANDGTPNAVVNRLRVTPDIEVDGRTEIASGQPIIVTIAPDHKRAYISNHSGATPAALAQEFQHGHAGSVTVVDLTRALDPEANETLHAVEGWIASEGFGATGFALLPDGKHGALAHAEAEGIEDGGHHINIVDLAAGRVIHKVEQAVGTDGCPPAELPKSAPDERFGCFPDSNGVTASPLGGPQGLIFTANGGTNDVSVIDIAKAVAGEPGAEIGRVPVEAGGFGITTSPDGTLVAQASRENPKDGKEANTISIIDVAKALAGEDATIARIPLSTGSDDPSRPRGVAITPDSRFAAITGAPPKNGHNSSMVWIVDLDTHKVKGRVTEIGSESYMIGHFAAD